MIIVSNSSPLIAYSRIGKLNLLKDLFGTIIIPMEVLGELNTRGHEFNHNWIEVRSISNISLKKSLELRLDCGESAAITLASELN
jgi:predicted nucleic acid-binding protein